MPINFISSDLRNRLKKNKKREIFILKITKISFLLGLSFLLLSFIPSIWFSISTKVDDFSAAILETVSSKEEVEAEIKSDPVPEWQPVFNQRLPRETTLKIPEINVDTVINERTVENYEDALRLGVWRVPDFGTPADRNRPMIIAAHRFGYLEWSNLFRRKNSFYNLPKLRNGDIVEIVYKQRKYTYEIYAEGRGDEINDYSANLILYTCETLNSKVRIFKYARLIKG